MRPWDECHLRPPCQQFKGILYAGGQEATVEEAKHASQAAAAKLQASMRGIGEGQAALSRA